MTIGMSIEMATAVVTGGGRTDLSLTVLYDERCPLCRRLRTWLGRQRTLHPIEFVAADSPEAHRRFPMLDHARTTRLLTVVASDGAVYEGERAWIVCGWTLPTWQPITEHAGAGIRLRVVRMTARLIDGYRHRRLPPRDQCPQCRLAGPDRPRVAR